MFIITSEHIHSISSNTVFHSFEGGYVSNMLEIFALKFVPFIVIEGIAITQSRGFVSTSKKEDEFVLDAAENEWNSGGR